VEVTAAVGVGIASLVALAAFAKWSGAWLMKAGALQVRLEDTAKELAEVAKDRDQITEHETRIESLEHTRTEHQALHMTHAAALARTHEIAASAQRTISRELPRAASPSRPIIPREDDET